MSETAIGWGVALALGSVTVAVVVNNLLGSYEDSKGHAYGAVSNTATVSVAAVAAGMVMPKEASPDPATNSAAAGTVVLKTFTITNDSNISDAYIISALSVSSGSIQSVRFTPSGAGPIAVTVGTTVSPTLARGGSLTVVVAISTAGVPVGTDINVTLSSKTTAPSMNGPQTSTGTAWIVVARGPEISGIATTTCDTPERGGTPLAPLFPVCDQVNGYPSAAAQPGATVTYTIPFTNVGGSPALGVAVSDVVPPQLNPVAGSLNVQSTVHGTGRGAATPAGTRIVLNANTVTATIPQLDPGIDITVTFQATVGAAAIGSTLSNPTTISAQSIAEVSAIPALVFIGVMDTVYDALAGSSHPVAGAAVAVVDPLSGVAVKLPASGTPPNPTNTNPFLTPSDGEFSFVLGASPRPENEHDLYVTATGYLNRKIKVAVLTASDGLPTTKLMSLDGLPLATAGGFGLTSTPVTVVGVTGFYGNVPLFPPQMLVLTIAVDRTVASAGDRLAYTVDFGPGSRPVNGTAELTVQLPPGVAFGRGTARIDGAADEPISVGRTMSWPFKDLASSRVLTFYAVVLPSVTEGTAVRTQAHLSVVVSSVPFGLAAGVDVAVVGGPLSARSILSGRVFADHARDGHFAPGDLGLAGVRIFLEDGESVETDRDGRFDFPAARPGMHVLHLDPTTLPPGMHAYHGFAVNDSRSILRLVHGIFDSGLMSDVNFAIAEGPGG